MDPNALYTWAQQLSKDAVDLLSSALGYRTNTTERLRTRKKFEWTTQIGSPVSLTESLLHPESVQRGGGDLERIGTTSSR